MKHPLALVLALGASATLTGCALAPGMDFEQFNRKPGVLDAWIRGEPTDPPPPGALKPITPALVRQLRAVPKADPAQELKPFFSATQPYRIGPIDTVSIIVWGHPEFVVGAGGATATGAATGSGSVATSGATSYTVSPSGEIFLPYIGAVRAGGLTEEELRAQLTTQLARLIRNPQVTASVQAFRSAHVYVDGEVRNPGKQAIDHVPMTLPEAISRAGGFAPTADRSAVLVTRNLKTVRVNVDELTARGIDPSRILLAHGDTVRVANVDDQRVYVLGEVSRAGPQPLKKGRLTLHQALGEAVGLAPNSGDPRQVFVVRPTNLDKPEVFHLDISSPLALAVAEGFELQDRDVVYVDPVPLVRWNRVISLILPSAQAVTVPRTVLDGLR